MHDLGMNYQQLSDLFVWFLLSPCSSCQSLYIRKYKYWDVFPLKTCSLLLTLTDHQFPQSHYSDIIMDTMASQVTSLTGVYSSVYSGADQRKHQSSASLAFVRIIPRWPVNSPHKGPVTRKMFSFDDVVMSITALTHWPMEHVVVIMIKAPSSNSF